MRSKRDDKHTYYFSEGESTKTIINARQAGKGGEGNEQPQQRKANATRPRKRGLWGVFVLVVVVLSENKIIIRKHCRVVVGVVPPFIKAQDEED